MSKRRNFKTRVWLSDGRFYWTTLSAAEVVERVNGPMTNNDMVLLKNSKTHKAKAVRLNEIDYVEEV